MQHAEPFAAILAATDQETNNTAITAIIAALGVAVFAPLFRTWNKRADASDQLTHSREAAYHQQIDRLAKDLSAMHEKYGGLNAKLEAQAMAIGTLNAKVQILETQNGALAQANAVLLAENSAFRVENALLKAEVNSLCEDLQRPRKYAA